MAGEHRAQKSWKWQCSDVTDVDHAKHGETSSPVDVDLKLQSVSLMENVSHRP